MNVDPAYLSQIGGATCPRGRGCAKNSAHPGAEGPRAQRLAPKKKPADQKADGLKDSTEADEPNYLPLTFSMYSAIIST